MYEYIKGEITQISPAFAVIEASGVGYMINISLNTYSEIEKHKAATLYIHYIVREDAQIFYGFSTRQEREIFRLLLGVSGVGGNTARMILSTYAPRELASIISTEKDTLLRQVKGLGTKTAQKIIVELRDKITGVLVSDSTEAPLLQDARSETYDEALAALTMLGFPKNASDKVLRSILKDSPGASVEEIVRLSLKNL